MSILESLKNLISPTPNSTERFSCFSPSSFSNKDEDLKRRRNMRQKIAKSKSGIWGPTHSQDSEDHDDDNDHQDSSVGPQTPEAASPPQETSNVPEKTVGAGAGASFPNVEFWNCTSAAIHEFLNPPWTPCNLCRGEERNSDIDGHRGKRRSSRSKADKSASRTGTDLSNVKSPLSQTISLHPKNSTTSSLTFGMAALDSSNDPNRGSEYESCAVSPKKTSTLHMEDLWQPPPPPNVPTPKSKVSSKTMAVEDNGAQKVRPPPPFRQIKYDTCVDFSRNISELTMKSCLGGGGEQYHITSSSSSRRMAYYAVGKQPSKESRGGNRRCYFTGALIRGGHPFYAGSVQQGSRTLVVFCLPKALGLPRREDLERLAMVDQDRMVEIKTCTSNVSQKSRKSHKSTSEKSQASRSRVSSVWSDNVAMDSYVTDNWEEDENGNVVESANADLLLLALPEPSQFLMKEMEERYGDQFLTLPQQIRSHKSWRLYMRFCFFSGLPIADGEMYYKVLDKITSKLRKQLRKAGLNEIILSHELMEAAHGCSSDIITLPTRKTFRYLHEHYGQQCAKLNDRVFKRTSWEKIMPEV